MKFFGINNEDCTSFSLELSVAIQGVGVVSSRARTLFQRYHVSTKIYSTVFSVNYK